MAKGQTGKASKRNVNVNVACGDRKMVFLLGLTAIMFTLSMVFIAKALYPRGVPVSFPGADCTVYDQELEQCSRKQTVATVALKKTINDLVTCKAEKNAELEALSLEIGAHDGVTLLRRDNQADLEAKVKNITRLCKDLETHHGALAESYDTIRKHLHVREDAYSMVHGTLGEHVKDKRQLELENYDLKTKDKTNEAIIDNLRATLEKSKFHQEREWIQNGKSHERSLAVADLGVYVYDLPEFSTDFLVTHTENYKKRCRNQLGEHHFHNLFLNDTRTRVMDGEKADLYYVPVYTGCYRTVMGEELRMDAYDATYNYIKKALVQIKKQPYWDRSQGRDHVWVFMYDYGVCLEYARTFASKRNIPPGLENSIMVGYVGDNSPGMHCYSTWKDVVVPAYIQNDDIVAAQGGKFIDPETRHVFAYFRGSIKWKLSQWHTAEMNYSNGVREFINNTYGNDELFSIKSGTSPNYIEEMASATFCLAPLGYSLWNFRFYEAIVMGCIPVIIADNIELPYEDMIDYRQFTVKILESQVTQMKDILLSIPKDKIRMKQEALKRVWKHFVYNHPTKEGDAFDLLLNQLRKKIRRFQPASKAYWF